MRETPEDPIGGAVFSWKVKRNLDPYFRAVYAMQLIAVGAVVAGLFLAWWGSSHGDHLTAFDILDRSTTELRQRKPTGIVQPLVNTAIVEMIRHHHDSYRSRNGKQSRFPGKEFYLSIIVHYSKKRKWGRGKGA